MSSQVTLCFKSGKMDQVLSISEITDSAVVILIGTLWADFCSSWWCECSEMRWADYNSTGSTVFKVSPSRWPVVLMEHVGNASGQSLPQTSRASLFLEVVQRAENNKGKVNAVWPEMIPACKWIQPPWQQRVSNAEIHSGSKTQPHWQIDRRVFTRKGINQ